MICCLMWVTSINQLYSSQDQDGDYVRLNDLSFGHQKAQCDSQLRADPFGLLQFSGTTFYARPSSTSTEASLKVVTISDTECEVFDGGQGHQETKNISAKVTGASNDAKTRRTRRNAIKVDINYIQNEFSTLLHRHVGAELNNVCASVCYIYSLNYDSNIYEHCSLCL
jgi:hypothetical protein